MKEAEFSARQSEWLSAVVAFGMKICALATIFFGRRRMADSGFDVYLAHGRRLTLQKTA